MTVKELYAACGDLIRSGLGEKEIWISNDDEGNGYHELFYSFMTDQEDIDISMEYETADKENVVILG